MENLVKKIDRQNCLYNIHDLFVFWGALWYVNVHIFHNKHYEIKPFDTALSKVHMLCSFKVLITLKDLRFK